MAKASVEMLILFGANIGCVSECSGRCFSCRNDLKYLCEGGVIKTAFGINSFCTGRDIKTMLGGNLCCIGRKISVLFGINILDGFGDKKETNSQTECVLGVSLLSKDAVVCFGLSAVSFGEAGVAFGLSVLSFGKTEVEWGIKFLSVE